MGSRFTPMIRAPVRIDWALRSAWKLMPPVHPATCKITRDNKHCPPLPRNPPPEAAKSRQTKMRVTLSTGVDSILSPGRKVCKRVYPVRQSDWASTLVLIWIDGHRHRQVQLHRAVNRS